jgi:hypothetical protein
MSTDYFSWGPVLMRGPVRLRSIRWNPRAKAGELDLRVKSLCSGLAKSGNVIEFDSVVLAHAAPIAPDPTDGHTGITTVMVVRFVFIYREGLEGRDGRLYLWRQHFRLQSSMGYFDSV